MVLADTSVWVDYLRRGDRTLAQLLTKEQVCIHLMIVGELACGHLHNREQLMGLWNNLPRVIEASHEEALLCLDRHNLMGEGIGYVDLHLLASTLLNSDTVLWTKDRRLHEAARSLGIALRLA